MARQGVSLILGDLEMAVLDHLWRTGNGDAKSVHRAIGIERGIALNTVQSALERLFRKKILGREKVSHAYVYAPLVQRAELMARLIDDIVQPLSDGRAEPFLAAFVDYATRADSDALDHLDALIAARRAASAPEKR